MILAKMMIKKGYVVNLDRRPDRLKEFISKEIPFPVERIQAIDSSLSGEPGYVGCKKSITQALTIADDRNEYPFAIFEDDCKLIQPWLVVENAMSQLPVDWDILYFGANLEHLNKKPERYSDNLYRVYDAYGNHGKIYGSQRVVRYIIENAYKHKRMDVFHGIHVCYKFNCYITYPLCAVQRKSYSDIVNGFRDYEQFAIDNYNKHIK